MRERGQWDGLVSLEMKILRRKRGWGMEDRRGVQFVGGIDIS